ncbi:PIN domain-containing protein [Halopenitus sp. H-Gu1]|uniref:PIN domain-containing protein n=1 Tax=Halopenitus sp. H-Gu1 TaxID=3242697 RepID=UPI00359ED4B7
MFGNSSRHEANGNATGSRTADRDSAAPVVALDTSALMAPVEANVRLFEELDRLLGEYRAVVPAAVRAELDRLADGGGTEAAAANVGADLAQRADLIDTDAANGTREESSGSTNEYADDVLVALAERGAVEYVVTNDRTLTDRILARNVPVIGLRGQNALAIREP